MGGLSVPGPSGARIAHRPFGVTAGMRKAPAVLLGSVFCLPTESSSPPAQCIKRVIFPQCCLHVCVCSVLPDHRFAFLPSLCLHSLSNVPFGMREHQRQGRLHAGGTVAPSLCSPPPFPGCMMEGGVFLSGVHIYGPAPCSEGVGAGGHGANMRMEGCAFTPGLLSQHRVLRCDGEQWLR